MESRVDPLTLSREELYELVWSKPMVELAEDFGLSDVALAKRCRKLGVPVPGRGYWARVAAGQAPRQPRLKKREERYGDESALTFSQPHEQDAEANEKAPTSIELAAIRERIQAFEATPEKSLVQASAAVKRTATELKRPWRKEITWIRGERSGPVLRLEVSDAVADRALRVCEQLLAGAAVLGWPFQFPSRPTESRRSTHGCERGPEASNIGCLIVEGEALEVRIDERRRRTDHVPTEEQKERRRRGQYVYAPSWDFIATGELRLHLSEQSFKYPLKTWKDGVKKRLEDQIKSILGAMAEEAFRIKADREVRRLAEIERRREENLEAELAERRRANAKLIHELETQVGAWVRARLLRLYVRTLRKAIGEEKLEAKLRGARIDFIAWAERYVDQLDPLSRTPHDPDLEPDDCGYRSVREVVDEMLARRLGHEYQAAWKVADDNRRKGVQRIAQDDEDDEDG